MMNDISARASTMYGQTKSTGTITCDSETTGLTCTDASTGHFFTMSREANTLG